MSSRASSRKCSTTEVIGNQNGLMSANFSAKLWRTTESLTWSHCCVSASRTIQVMSRLAGNREPSTTNRSTIKTTHSLSRQRPRPEGKCKKQTLTLQWPNLLPLPRSLPSLEVVTQALSQATNTTKNPKRSQTLAQAHLQLTRDKLTKLSSLTKPQPGLTYRTSGQTWSASKSSTYI